MRARSRESQPVVEFRVPFTVDRQAVDDVERGAKDSDWQPVKDAAKQIAFAEDRAVFDGFAAAGIAGIRASSSNPAVALPADVREYPTAVAQALTALRLAGVDGPYSLLLSADAYTAVAETTDHGYPIREHIARVAAGRRDHLGARDRRRLPALDPRRRLRAAPRPGPVDRLPVPRRRPDRALLPGVADLLRPDQRGRSHAHCVVVGQRPKSVPHRAVREDSAQTCAVSVFRLRVVAPVALATRPMRRRSRISATDAPALDSGLLIVPCGLAVLGEVAHQARSSGAGKKFRANHPLYRCPHHLRRNFAKSIRLWAGDLMSISPGGQGFCVLDEN